MEKSTKNLLSVKETAGLFDISEKTVYRWISAGTIPHIRVGEQYRFSREDIVAWGQSSGKRIPPELICGVDEGSEKLPLLSQAINNGGIYYQVDGTNSEKVIEEALSLIRLPQNVDRKFVYDSLLARESLATTGIGNGIAIPHLRYAFKELKEPQLSICILAEPVNWNSIDGRPVGVIFIPLCPGMKSHLHLLSQLSYALKHPEWFDVFDNTTTRREIIESLEEIEKDFYKS
ncbi:MAG: PTS sugar transporter subunit IIA [Planctomycetota bacterium]|jgi:PTS system nitrogen regulatory IIA component